MGDFGNDYGGTATDQFVPKVTEEMLVRAVRVLFGYAEDAADAKSLAEAMGFTREMLERARRW